MVLLFGLLALFPIGGIFGLTAIGGVHWIIVVGLSAVPTLMRELCRKIDEIA
jgi:hypothetical protein